MASLLADPLPAGVFAPEEAAIVNYARKSTRLEPIDDATYGALKQYFDDRQIIDLCMTVGLSNVINRFHATFQTDVDADTLAEVEAGNAAAGVCPISLPAKPG